MPVHCRVRLQWCLALSGWNHADWRRIAFSGKSGFQLCPDDHRRRFWRRPGQPADSAFTIAHHIVLQPRYSGLIFQQDSAKPHTNVAMNCLTAYQILPRPDKSPYLSPVEHVCDVI
ncbi:transposable element Tc1 transposase [Trichonephila clavipes]|nr:transposable element Tc1 transposase [Trichonephila clavipes]